MRRPPSAGTSPRDDGPSRLEEKRGETQSLARNALMTGGRLVCATLAITAVPTRRSRRSRRRLVWASAPFCWALAIDAKP